MAITFNPFDVVKYIRENRNESKQEFVHWLSEVQKEARALLDAWVKIGEDLEVSDQAEIPEAAHKVLHKFGVQSVSAAYLKEFYMYVSTVAQGRVDPTIMGSISGWLSTCIYRRELTRKSVEQYVRDLRDKKIFYMDSENRTKNLRTIQDAIGVLQRELVGLDVFIETVKANPQAYK